MTLANELRAAQQRLRGIDVMLEQRWSFTLAGDRSDTVATIERLRQRLLDDDHRQLHPENTETQDRQQHG